MPTLKDEDFYDSTVEVTVSRDMSALMQVAEDQQAMLLVLSGARIGHRVVLGEQPLSIGRGSNCALILDADSVSRHHAVVEWSGGEHRLIDKGSTNGTFVNHHRVGERALHDGDQIQIGKALLKYLAGGNIEAMYHEEFQRLMHHDGLTGARTKASFEEAYRVALMMERAKPKPVSFIVFDIDHFKRVNDTHGHTAGDAVLQQLSAIVEAVLASRYLYGRLGGEEFGILLEGDGLGAACELAEQIRTRVANSKFTFEDVHIPITLSFGVAERPPGSSEGAEDFFERTDQLLYAAKSAGRNCVRC
jgi:diguanylate cyclase (GGDEF)-like protein